MDDAYENMTSYGRLLALKSQLLEFAGTNGLTSEQVALLYLRDIVKARDI